MVKSGANLFPRIVHAFLNLVIHGIIFIEDNIAQSIFRFGKISAGIIEILGNLPFGVLHCLNLPVRCVCASRSIPEGIRHGSHLSQQIIGIGYGISKRICFCQHLPNFIISIGCDSTLSIGNTDKVSCRGIFVFCGIPIGIRLRHQMSHAVIA